LPRCRGGPPRRPPTAVLGALAGVVVTPAALAAGCSAVAVAASLLLALSAVGLATRRRARTAVSPQHAVRLGALIAATVIVAAVLTPALATTDAPGHIGDLPSGRQSIHSGH
ncbi:hypothetical protein, partial [Microbacterium sp. NPDC057650]|uniref:hypothetical protein n=1 Tax=Microbacterium sp. NPDC057650 TaxID=3346193 RepID=UPI00366E696B